MTNKKYEIYGADGQTANQLYKKYSTWNQANGNGKSTLNFSDWLGWAKNKGLVEDNRELQAEGEEEETTEETAEESTMGKVKNNTATMVIFWIAVLAAVGIVVGFAKSK